MTKSEQSLTENDKDVIVFDSQTEPEDGSDTPTYDPSKLNLSINEDPQSVFQLVRKAGKEQLILDPEFQRNQVWKSHQKSRFIESVLMNFPIPPFYVNEREDGRWIIIDGLQRSGTLIDFLNNKFCLEGLKALPHLNGLFFRDLPQAFQSRIEDKKLNIYILKASTPLPVIYELFDRINTGGTPLNRQEVRHCIFQGQATRLLKELSEQDYFKQAIGHGVSPRRMKDRELILRYLSFRIQNYQTDYKGDLSAFVEKTLVIINGMNPEQLQALREDFERVMRLSYDFFGDRNFRLPILDPETGATSKRGFINTSMFESIGAFFSEKSDDFLLRHRERIVQNFDRLLQNEGYRDAVRFSTGAMFRVNNRFGMAMDILGQV